MFKIELGYRLSIPQLDPELVEQVSDEVIELLSSMAAATVFKDAFYYIDIGSSHAVRDFLPNMAIIEQYGQIGLVITGACLAEEKEHFISCSFAPGVGILEDQIIEFTHAHSFHIGLKN